MLEFREAPDEYRAIDRAAQRAADERGARRAQARDGLIGAAFFLDLDPWYSASPNVFSRAHARGGLYHNPRISRARLQCANSATARLLSKGASSMPVRNPPMCARNAMLAPPSGPQDR